MLAFIATSWRPFLAGFVCGALAWALMDDWITRRRAGG